MLVKCFDPWSVIKTKVEAPGSVRFVHDVPVRNLDPVPT